MRYYFNIQHGKRSLPDAIGEELADDDAAWKEATVTAGKLLQDLDGTLKPDREWRMEVSDESGKLVWVLRVLAERH